MVTGGRTMMLQVSCQCLDVDWERAESSSRSLPVHENVPLFPHPTDLSLHRQEHTHSTKWFLASFNCSTFSYVNPLTKGHYCNAWWLWSDSSRRRGFYEAKEIMLFVYVNGLSVGYKYWRVQNRKFSCQVLPDKLKRYLGGWWWVD